MTFYDDDPDYTKRHFREVPEKSNEEINKLITLLANKAHKAIVKEINDYTMKSKEVVSLNEVTGILTFVYCFLLEDMIDMFPANTRKALFRKSIDSTVDYLNGVIDKMDFSRPRTDPKDKDWKDLK